MKKKSILALTVLFSGFMFVACNKCSTCSYSFRYDTKDSTVNMAETCGSKKDISKYEDNAAAIAARNGSSDLKCTQE